MLALFVTLFAETLGLPLPGESALLATSTFAGEGKFNILHVAATAWAAAILGDNVSYLLGRRLGRPTLLYYGGKVGITEKQLQTAESVMDRFGFLVVLTARFFPLLRQLNGLVAGTTGMRWHIFVMADIVGCAFWVTLWSTLGYNIGHSKDLIPDVLHQLKALSHYIIPIVLLLLVLLTFARLISLRRARRAKAKASS